MFYHYVYRITNIKENKHYYGSRTTDVFPTRDLGVKYFSSSKDKIFKHDQKTNPKNYKYKIIYIFDNRADAISLEIKLHNKFNVGVNKYFYNKAKQSSTTFDTTGITQVRKGNLIHNIPIGDYDKQKYSHMNKDYIVSKELGRVTRQEYESSGLTHINKGMVDVIIDNKITKITVDAYNKGSFVTPRHNTIVVHNKITNVNEVIPKALYDETIHRSVNKDMVKAYDTVKKVCVTVSKNEFDHTDYLVGINTHIVNIYDSNDNLLLTKIGKIREVVRDYGLPQLFTKCKTKEKTDPRSGLYYTSARIYNSIKN